MSDAAVVGDRDGKAAAQMRSIWLSYEVVSIDDEGNAEFRVGDGDETVTVGHDAFLPGSPALPSVAEWLVKNPDGAEALARVSRVAYAMRKDAHVWMDDPPDIEADCAVLDSLISAMGRE